MVIKYSIVKKISVFALLITLSAALSSCFKNYDQEYFQYKTQTVEFDDAVTNSRASSKHYPMLPGLTALNGVKKYRVNFFGKQSSKDELIDFKIDLSESTALEGRDFRIINADKKVLVPANSSFGYVEVEVLPTLQGQKQLVLELLGNSTVVVAKTYRSIGIQLTAFGKAVDEALIERHTDFLYAKHLQIGHHNNENIPGIVDMRNALIYYFPAAQLVNASNLNFVYMHSGTSSSNQVNFVPPGYSAMLGDWGQAVYNKFVSWTGIKNSAKFYKVGANKTALVAQYDGVTSATDIKNLYDAISLDPDRLTGERIVKLTTGDIVGYYCPELDYYAVIKIKSALNHTDFAAIGITSTANYYLDFEYKVQK